MDPNVAAEVVPAIIGATAGFIGGATAALMRYTSVPQVLTAVIGGTGTGAFVAPFIVTISSLPANAVGMVGFVGGLGVFGLIRGVEGIATRFGDDPESMLPSFIRDLLPKRTKPPGPPDSPPGGPPK